MEALQQEQRWGVGGRQGETVLGSSGGPAAGAEVGRGGRWRGRGRGGGGQARGWGLEGETSPLNPLSYLLPQGKYIASSFAT